MVLSEIIMWEFWIKENINLFIAPDVDVMQIGLSMKWKWNVKNIFGINFSWLGIPQYTVQHWYSNIFIEPIY